MIPCELFIQDGEIDLMPAADGDACRRQIRRDRPIQVGSHDHFFRKPIRR